MIKWIARGLGLVYVGFVCAWFTFSSPRPLRWESFFATSPVVVLFLSSVFAATLMVRLSAWKVRGEAWPWGKLLDRAFLWLVITLMSGCVVEGMLLIHLERVESAVSPVQLDVPRWLLWLTASGLTISMALFVAFLTIVILRLIWRHAFSRVIANRQDTDVSSPKTPSCPVE